MRVEGGKDQGCQQRGALSVPHSCVSASCCASENRTKHFFMTYENLKTTVLNTCHAQFYNFQCHNHKLQCILVGFYRPEGDSPKRVKLNHLPPKKNRMLSVGGTPHPSCKTWYWQYHTVGLCSNIRDRKPAA